LNPACAAFTCTEAELKEKWALIPEDVDILVTHSPPYGILDGTLFQENVGSISLYERLYSEKIKPRLHVFGHVHESYGHWPEMLDFPHTQFVNASHCNQDYKAANKPIRVIL
jgi:Icc-related predicted phosphoesterase